MPRLRVLSAVLIGTLALTACGDDDPTPAAASADAPADCGAEGGDTVTVSIPEFLFEPTPVEIAACDSVVWTNAHDQAHTSTGTGDQDWSTGNLQAGVDSEPVRFESAGSFTYICALHPFMKGTVEVA